MNAIDSKDRPGLVAGRFQPLHYGHVEYIMAAFRRCSHLYIGITHPDPGVYYESATDLHRSLPSANPFSYELRKRMITELMADSRISRKEFDVIPIRLENPDDCRTHLPPNTTVMVTIYDEWGQAKRRLFEEMGFDVEVLWERRETIARGAFVRERIKENMEWEFLVPPSTHRVVLEWLAKGNSLNGASGQRRHEIPQR